MMIFLGVVLILVGSYLSIYIAKLDEVKHLLSMLPSSIIPSEFVLTSSVFIVAYVIYAIFESNKNKHFFKEVERINNALNNYMQGGEFELEESKAPFVRQNIILLNHLINKFQEAQEKDKKIIEELQEEVSNLEDLVDLQSTLVCKVTENGKVIKSNRKFLKFLAFESESKLNMKIKNIKDLFDEKLDDDWLSQFLHTEQEVTLKGVKFLLRVEKVERYANYVLSLVDMTKFEEEKKKIEEKVFHSTHNIKTEAAMNKTLETMMIKILNYENYAEHLGSGILEVFEEHFVNKIKSLGYDDIFRIEKSLFAVYDSKVDFLKIKKVLEENIEISVGGDEFMFTPKVMLGSGVNFEQAYQQIIESCKTLIPKEKNEVKYPLELIKIINKAIIQNKVVLGYQAIENQNKMIIVNPSIKDDYDSTIIDQKLVTNVATEFNLYLMMLKQVIINNIELLKNYKIVLNVTTEDLLSTTMLSDLLFLIKREELFVVFNIDINSKYSNVFPILKQIKSSAQISIRNVGRGYINFKDIYALKIDYLEVDETITALVNKNKNWKFLLDSIKLLVSAQQTTLLSKNYKDDKVFRISENMKIYEG